MRPWPRGPGPIRFRRWSFPTGYRRGFGLPFQSNAAIAGRIDIKRRVVERIGMIVWPRAARRRQSMPCDLGGGHFSEKPFRRPPTVRFRQVSQAAGGTRSGHTARCNPTDRFAMFMRLSRESCNGRLFGLNGHRGLARWSAAPLRVAAVRTLPTKNSVEFSRNDRLSKMPTHTFDPERSSVTRV